MSVNMNTITNKDAKMIYSKYWYKNMGMEMFPTIYIDKYWDYTINLFELNDDWNWFLERFNEEFKSAKEYIEESEKVKDILLDNFCTSDINEKLMEYHIDNYNFIFKNTYDIPEDEYWVIDLKEAFNQTLEYLNVIQPGVTFKSVLNSATKSELLRNSKILRFQLYYKFKFSFKSILYSVCDKLLYKLSQSNDFKNMVHFEDIYCIHGDSIYISTSKKTNLVIGDIIVDGISVHIRKQKVKSIIYKNQKIKWLDTGNATNLFYKNNYPQYVSTDEYLCLMKTIKNQQLNQIDKTVGFEDEIFFIMD